MEAFSLLKYWRGGGAIGGCDATPCGPRTTILTTAAYAGTESDTDNDDGDDGPFFDLEFAVHDGDEEEEDAAGGGDCLGDGRKSDSSSSEEEGSEVCGEEEEAGEELNFTLSSLSSSSSAASFASGDGCAGGSPSDGLFFKGRLVPIESAETSSQNPNSKPTHLPVSLMKSATRLRVFMLGLKKSKSNQPEQPPEKSQTGGGKLLAVKLKVEEVPIMSLFARDSNSSRSQKQSSAAGLPLEEGGDAAHSSDEKIFFSKEALQRYLKKVKPLYVRVSKRYGEKLRFSSSGQLGAAGKAQIDQPSTAPGDSGAACVKGPIRPGSIPAGLRVVCKHLGKSRSASSAVAAAPSGPSSSSSRRDDSLLQQQDGIQSAILHCKRSFNASRDSDSSLLGRSASEPMQDRSTELLRRREIIELNLNSSD